jgi:hypothetical protein
MLRLKSSVSGFPDSRQVNSALKGLMGTLVITAHM